MSRRIDRRSFLRLAGASAGVAALPQCIRAALAIPADTRTGTIQDVEHVVILMQENRSFDHYFGTLPGVRGFGDRFPVPLASGKPVWYQRDQQLNQMLPYHLDSTKGNAQRVSGTPHGWEDGHLAWNEGRSGFWPAIKEPQSMGYYTEQELPFQFALANAFTICDAYHCAVLSSTNPNRLFMFTGTNDPRGEGGGPAKDNTNDDLGPSADGYSWTTYAERLEAAGVSWKVYQDMDDNFTDNSLEGFQSFRLAYENREADPNHPLLVKGLSSTLKNNTLDGLKADVLAGALPQVSYIVGPATYSEHTGPSSPVQGAWYTQQVIEALTADPAVWSRTVLLVMFDENDGFFDHVPPPCAPSLDLLGQPIGASTCDDTTERYKDPYLYSNGWVFGPGIRVPMYVISPWSRGGWVNSQTFDHTSIIRFLEARFGVQEPNISAWRRAACGDLTSCFNFANPNDEAFPTLPSWTREQADQIRSAQEQLAQIAAPTNGDAQLPVQASGLRYSRALPYEFHVTPRLTTTGSIELRFDNSGTAGAVFHVYDQRHLSNVPRRYMVEAGKSLTGSWSTALDLGEYDLWVLGPNGFHRHFTGNALMAMASAAQPEVAVCYDVANGDLYLRLRNDGSTATTFTVTANAYRNEEPWTFEVNAGEEHEASWALADSAAWYDFTVTCDALESWSRRVAGRIETGRASFSDPAMGV
jgi:phospholipase C